jgi:hypothetical protein
MWMAVAAARSRRMVADREAAPKFRAAATQAILTTATVYAILL